MRLLSTALHVLRCSSSTRGFAVCFSSRSTKICYAPVDVKFFNAFRSLRVGTPRLYFQDFPTRKVQLRQYTHIIADEESELFTDYSSEEIRLYPDHDCELINRVLAAPNVEEITNLTNVVSSLDLKLASQIVVTVNELLKSSYAQQCDEYLSALQRVQSSSLLQKCLETFEKNFSDLQDNVLLDVFLALANTISTDHVLFTKFLFKCQDMISHLSLKDLSKFCIVMSRSGNRFLPLVAPVIDRISTTIQDCKTEEDIRSLAICLASGIAFASSDCLSRFAKQIEDFIFSGKEIDFKTAINCLTFLNFAGSQIYSVKLQHLLISFLIDFVPKLNSIEIRLTFQNILHVKCNTDSIMTAIEQRINALLEESRNVSETVLLLSCVNKHMSSLKHKLLVSHCIKTTGNSEFYALRDTSYTYLLINMLYNIFPLQNKEFSLNLLKLCCTQDLPINVLKKVVKKLLYFRKTSGSSMTGENMKKFTDLCYCLAENSVKCHEIALFSSFVMTDLNPIIPVKFIQRVNSILLQLNIQSLSIVSQSLSIAFRNRHLVSQAHQKELTVLSSNLLKQFINLIPSCENLTDYNNILRSILDISSLSLSAGQSTDAIIRDSFFNEYSRFLENENFKINDIISTCITISNHKMCLPHVLDAVAQCIVEQPATQSAKAVAHTLQACYAVNYNPQIQEFLKKCQDMIMSKNQLFSCQGLLQSAICLGLNSALNDQIIRLIFCEEFLERLEKEISVHSISQARTIRMALAQVNRIVCLDYPEKNVPWFHEQYCKSLQFKENPHLSELEKEVYKALCQVLPGKEYIQTKIHTPYHYLISFEVLLDKTNQPLQSREQKSPCLEIQRVAVDVLPESQYCRNIQQLTGQALLKKRHLETLAYKLVQVPFFEWKSLQLRNKKSQADYLHNKIFQST